MNPGGKLITRKQICKNQGISPSYLESILITLKNNGIIKTTRGPGGGYKLALPPSEITILRIVELFEGGVSPVYCVNNSEECSRSGVCLTRDVWSKLKEAVKKTLREITIEDLVSQSRNPGFSI